jgi:Flp pilus assembly protein TadD
LTVSEVLCLSVWGIWKDRYHEIKDEYIGWDMQVQSTCPFPALAFINPLLARTDELSCTIASRVWKGDFASSALTLCYISQFHNTCISQIHMGKPGLRGERYEVFPIFSRVNNIGESEVNWINDSSNVLITGVEGGAHQNAVKTESMERQYIQHWAGSQDQVCAETKNGQFCGDGSFKELADVAEACDSVHFGADTLSTMCSTREEQEAMRAWQNQIQDGLADGKRQLESGNIAGAITAYEKVRTIAPSSTEYMFPLAIAYANTQGKAEEAKKLLIAFLDVNPTAVNARFTLGNLYAQAREIDPALKEFKVVVTQDSTHGEAHSNLAVAYHQKGLGEEAAVHYKRALELGVESSRANYEMLLQQMQAAAQA